ncbi:MAG: sigma-70 family RNA polymerase sigma factor, partial [Bacteroidota bacterium]
EIEEESDENIEQIFEQKELRIMILSELETIPIEQKDVFLLKEYGGLSYKEIAKLNDIDENLVKARLYKVRQKLIKRLSKKL